MKGQARKCHTSLSSIFHWQNQEQNKGMEMYCSCVYRGKTHTHTHILLSFTHSQFARLSRCRLYRQEASSPHKTLNGPLWPGDPAVYNQLTVTEHVHKTNNHSREKRETGRHSSHRSVANLKSHWAAFDKTFSVFLKFYSLWEEFPWSLFLVVLDDTHPLKVSPPIIFTAQI